jgi:NitT/TauT family transport system substrate-binding protein
MPVLPGPARAEVSEITVAEQYGLATLPLMLMQKRGLVEKHAAAVGVTALKVNWSLVAGPSVMNDGLLSGAIQFAAQGAPSLITLAERTRRNVAIKGVAAVATYPVYLVSRNPAVHSVRDLSSADKIAVPSVKISTQAIMLQIAAAEAFGEADYTRLDPYTISLAHPDAMAALSTGTAGVNAHFTSSPFYAQEMKIPGVHLVTTNYEILGGPATALILTASARFRDANPAVYRAVYDGLAEAIDAVNADKEAAARLYLEMSGDRKTTVAEIMEVITDKDYAYSLRPLKVLKTAQWMAKFGSVKETPAKVEDLFFSEAAGLGGD